MNTVSKPKSKKQAFKSDFRKEKPGLHNLYVEFAVRNLATIDLCLKQIYALGQVPMCGITLAMMKEREKLVREDAAYAEANKLLKIAHNPSERDEGANHV